MKWAIFTQVVILKNRDLFKKEGFIGEGKIYIEDEGTDFPILMKISMKECDERSPILEFTTTIEMDQGDEPIINYYTLTFHGENTFHILIASENWGYVEGNGFIKQGFIGWEIASADQMFHGHESIETKGENDYRFFGEYASKEEMRTKIVCRLVSYENISS